MIFGHDAVGRQLDPMPVDFHMKTDFYVGVVHLLFPVDLGIKVVHGNTVVEQMVPRRSDSLAIYRECGSLVRRVQYVSMQFKNHVDACHSAQTLYRLLRPQFML